MSDNITINKSNYSGKKSASLNKGAINNNISFTIEQYKNKNVSLDIRSRSLKKEEFLKLVNCMIEAYEKLD